MLAYDKKNQHTLYALVFLVHTMMLHIEQYQNSLVKYELLEYVLKMRHQIFYVIF